MKQTTKGMLAIAVASALAIGATSGVFAGAGFGPGYGFGGHHGMMGGAGTMHGGYGGTGWMHRSGPLAFDTARLGQIKADLAITADQEPAWNAYVDAVANGRDLMAAHHQTRYDGTAGADPRATFHEEGLEQMRKLDTATRDLYAVLTPAQQTRAGTLTVAACPQW
ncbi:MAG: Spy/CpxP family protein refolding chaperone [Gammaproteobacteria bacterium]|nr:Spy/CpxP family protein refolding chaperone [Gammaproteobacteria bacterium]